MKRLILAIALAGAALGAEAQTLLAGAEAAKKLPMNFSLSAGLEYRSQQWFSHSDQWSVDAALGYKPVKPLKLSVGYKFIQAYTPETVDRKGRNVSDHWVGKHRISVSATGELKLFGRLTLSLRERYQYTYRPLLQVPRFDLTDGTPDGNKTIEKKSKHVLRSRLMAEFKPYKKCRFTPYVSWELYSLLGETDHTAGISSGAQFNDKWRLTAGSSFRIDKRNSLDLFYRYCRNADADENDEPHTIGLTYSFKF